MTARYRHIPLATLCCLLNTHGKQHGGAGGLTAPSGRPLGR